MNEERISSSIEIGTCWLPFCGFMSGSTIPSSAGGSLCFHADRGEGRDLHAAGQDGRLDVGEEVLHHETGVALLQAHGDRVLVPLGAGAAEGEQAEAQPLLEKGLLLGVVTPGLAQ